MVATCTGGCGRTKSNSLNLEPGQSLPSSFSPSRECPFGARSPSYLHQWDVALSPPLLWAHDQASEATPNSNVRTRLVGVWLSIRYCHKHRVAHRDLKPENVIFYLPKEEGWHGAEVVKVTDFGLSNSFKDNTMMDTWCGSLSYSAPEVGMRAVRLILVPCICIRECHWFFTMGWAPPASNLKVACVY
jgi:serine/threonine protein kinase